MTAIDLRTEIIRMLKDVKDTNILEQVKTFVHDRLKAAGSDISDEDLAELDRRRAEYLRGEGSSFTMGESLQRLRSGKR